MTAANEPDTANNVKEQDHHIDTRDSSEIVVRVYQGRNSKGGPALVMLHGGGFCLGGLDNEALLCRQFCEKYNGVSVNVDYRLAPEHKFPIPVYDCYDALEWVLHSMLVKEGVLTSTDSCKRGAHRRGLEQRLRRGRNIGRCKYQLCDLTLV